MIAFSLAPVFHLRLKHNGATLLGISGLVAVAFAVVSLFGWKKKVIVPLFVCQGLLTASPVVIAPYMLEGPWERFCMIASLTCYFTGAFIYAKEWPDPVPNHFGYHEIWHLLIAVAAAITYSLNLTVIQKEVDRCADKCRAFDDRNLTLSNKPKSR